MKALLKKINAHDIAIKIILLFGVFLFLSIYFAELIPLDNIVNSIWGADNARYPSVIILVGAIAIIIIFMALMNLQSRLTKRQIHIFSLFLIVFLLVVQVIMIFRYTYVGNYDALVTKIQSYNLLNGAKTWPEYFYYYTNTVGFVSFMARLLEFGSFFGWLGTNPEKFTALFQFLLVDVSILGIFWTVRRRSLSAANIFLILALIYQPLYTNSFEFYSDSFSLIFPALFIFLNDQIFNNNRQWTRFVAIGLLSFTLAMAFFIKQNLIILIIAEAMLIVIFWKDTTQQEKISLFGGVVAAFMTLLLVFTFWRTDDGYKTNQNRSFPIYTWIALGYQKDTQGQFNLGDFYAYDSITSGKEKTNYAKNLLINRLKDLGPDGIFNQWVNKFRVMWGDGSFDSLRYQNSFLGPLPQYDKNPVRTEMIIRNFNQTLIVSSSLIAAFAFIRAIVKRKSETISRDQRLLTIFVLPILGLTTFHVIFWEVEARYVTPLIPLMIGIASVSIIMIFSEYANRMIISRERASMLSKILIVIAIIVTLFSAIKLPKNISLPAEDKVVNSTASLPNGVHDKFGKNEPLFGKNSLFHYYLLKADGRVDQNIVTSVASNQIWFSELPDGVVPYVFVNEHYAKLKLMDGQTYEFNFPAGEYKVRLVNTTNKTVKIPELYGNFPITSRPITTNKANLAIATYNSKKNILKDLQSSNMVYLILSIGLMVSLYSINTKYTPDIQPQDDLADVKSKTKKRRHFNNKKSENKPQENIIPPTVNQEATTRSQRFNNIQISESENIDNQ